MYVVFVSNKYVGTCQDFFINGVRGEVSLDGAGGRHTVALHGGDKITVRRECGGKLVYNTTWRKEDSAYLAT